MKREEKKIAESLEESRSDQSQWAGEESLSLQLQWAGRKFHVAGKIFSVEFGLFDAAGKIIPVEYERFHVAGGIFQMEERQFVHTTSFACNFRLYLRRVGVLHSLCTLVYSVIPKN